jgi:hypothetical protein
LETFALTPLPQKIEISNVPPYVEPWSVARIPKFVVTVLERWQRNHGDLPSQFYAVMCPQVEVNAAGGLPSRVVALTDPRLRCRHFTGCHKPYFVALFCGADADQRCAEAQRWLSWSESYRVTIDDDAVRLAFIDATEEAPAEETQGAHRTARTLKELLATGEIVSIIE